MTFTPLMSTVADLPPPDARWVIRRKALVVRGVQEGAIALADACERYSLSPEEFDGWERAIARDGNKGLRVTKQYRRYGRLRLGRRGRRAAEPA